MIIQCDQCKTKFKLDDSRVTENGVRVRCSRCKHTFVVRKEIPEVEPDYDMVLQGLGDTSGAEQSQADISDSPSSESSPGEETDGEFTFPAKSRADDSPAATVPETYAQEDPATSEKDASCSEEEDVSAAFSFDLQAVQEKPADDVAGEFASPIPNGDLPPYSDLSYPLKSPSDTASVEHEENAITAQSGFAESAGDVHSGNDSVEQDWEVFSKALHDEKFVSPDVPERQFSVEDLEAGNPDVMDADASHDSPAFFPTPVCPQGVENHIIFPKMDDDRAEQPADDRSSVESGATSTAVPLDSHYVEVPQVAEDELPPLNISSRRKGNRFQSLIFAVVILAAVCLVAWGAYSLSGGVSEIKKLPGTAFFADLLGLGTKGSEGIVVKKLDGSFLANQEGGEIFVIRGEAFNQSDRSRAVSQVKCIIYGAGGEVLLQKPAKCGILLADEQLIKLPMDKVEESLRNQTANSAQPPIVSSGRGMSFLAVFRNVPRSAVKYGAEVVAADVLKQ